MHAIVQFDGVETVSSVGSQRTPDIDNVVVQDAPTHMVGKFRRDTPQPGILSPLTNATHNIVSVQQLQQGRDIAGIILQIGIESDNSGGTDFFKSSM